MKGQKIVVWFSCGAASAVAAKITIDKYGKDNEVIIVNTPIKQEDEDNRRFFSDVEKWLGQKIELAVNSKYPDSSIISVFDKAKYMSGPEGAPCTKQLKKEARYQWQENNKPDWHVLGFTFDKKERKRHKMFRISELKNVIPVLITHKITKRKCFEMVKRAGIKLPRIYSLGYPNANCIGCVKASSPTYWNHVRKVHPEVFKERAEQSRRIGCKLAVVKSEHIYLDELSPEAKGRPMKDMNVECGIFCEITN